MGITKRMAVAVSGLVFAGAAALAVGAAAPASSEVRIMAPGQLVADGCCGGRHHNRWHSHHRNHFRTNQRVIVVNRNHNFSRSESENAQQQRGIQRHNQPRRGFEEEED
ncbi:MAG: hypothetical protein JWO67_4146 [Streptosporangiaceae bacterium]|nr:hypothetical protein [Streptosporangiaceae bacterium]